MSDVVPTTGILRVDPAAIYTPAAVASQLGITARTARACFPFVQVSGRVFVISGAALLAASRRKGQRGSGDSRGGSGHRGALSPAIDGPAGRLPPARSLREIPGGRQRSGEAHEA